jgi:hypothetical protein
MRLSRAYVSPASRHLSRGYASIQFVVGGPVPIPEVPTIVDATIVEHPQTGRECLLATTENGERIAFAFEVESSLPGAVIVDPALWLNAPGAGAPEQSPARFEAVEEPQADDWLQALITHPVSAEWLSRIKDEHPDAYHRWFAQEEYEEGGEQ